MTRDEQKYSDYVKDLSKVRVTMLSLISGFTFTTIIFLLYWLPDPTSLLAQITLLFLTIIFSLLLFLLVWQTVIVMGLYDVRNPPSREKWELTVFNLILFVIFFLWGLTPTLIFFLWNLVYLALAAAIMWILIFIFSERVARAMRKRLGWSIREGLKS